MYGRDNRRYEMSVYGKGIDEDGDLISKLSTNDKKVEPSKLEEAAIKQGYHPQDVQNVRESAEAIQTLDTLLDEYRKNEFDALYDELMKNGYQAPRVPIIREAMKGKEGIVAYTNAYDRIGVNSNLEGAIEALMKNAQISRKVAEYLVISEELIHYAQPDQVLMKGRNAAEADAKRVVTNLLYKKMQNAQNQEEAKD